MHRWAAAGRRPPPPVGRAGVQTCDPARARHCFLTLLGAVFAQAGRPGRARGDRRVPKSGDSGEEKRQLWSGGGRQESPMGGGGGGGAGRGGGVRLRAGTLCTFVRAGAGAPCARGPLSVRRQRVAGYDI